MKSSGIGGQAVLEGVMMRHKEDIAVAVRRPDGKIEIGRQKVSNPAAKHKILGLPIIRGVVSFIFSLVIGLKTLTFSASFYEDIEEPANASKKDSETSKPSEISAEAETIEAETLHAEVGATEDEALNTEAENQEVDISAADIENPANEGPITKEMSEKKTSKAETAAMGFAMVLALVIALVLFVALPYGVSALIVKYTSFGGTTLLAIIEGIIKLGIFIGYVALISKMNDIKRTFMYHGAEHKCINCIESGLELNVDNVMASSKEHRRCGTSFIFFVLFLSIIFFIFIRVDTVWLRLLIRLLLIPVIAGLSYEFIQWAGNSDSKLAGVLSKPGLWVQALTTKEPDREMAEVGIASVEAVFDWRGYLREQGIDVKDPETDNVTEVETVIEVETVAETETVLEAEEAAENIGGADIAEAIV